MSRRRKNRSNITIAETVSENEISRETSNNGSWMINSLAISISVASATFAYLANTLIQDQNRLVQEQIGQVAMQFEYAERMKLLDILYSIKDKDSKTKQPVYPRRIRSEAFSIFTQIEHNSKRSVDLRESVLVGISVKDCDFRGYNIDASFSSLKGSSIERVNFQGCKFSSANFSSAAILQVIFEDSKLFRTNFSGAKLTFCDFSNVNLKEADFKNAEILECTFHNADLGKVDMNGAIVYENRWIKRVGNNAKGFDTTKWKMIKQEGPVDRWKIVSNN